ncbi:MAG: hypothetical protein SVT52_09405 [Planctomycetota bacterium]|nr:hypothetical protein [Planctomycetota bacterium]
MFVQNKTVQVLIVALIVISESAASPTAEQHLVNELYGNQIIEVKASAGEDDDIELGRELLRLAGDESQSVQLRHILATTALELLLPLSSEAACELAETAMELADVLQPLSESDRVLLKRRLCAGRLRVARAGEATRQELAALARAAAVAEMQYVRLVFENQADMSVMAEATRRASRLIRIYKLTDLKARLAETEKLCQYLNVRERKLKDAKMKFAAARRIADQDLMRSARRAIGRIYLEYDGDLVEAAGCLAGTKDPDEPVVAAAAAFLNDPEKLDSQQRLKIAAALITLAEPLAEIAKKRVATCAMQMCELVLADEHAQASAAKARLLIAQLKLILQTTPVQELLAKLGEYYSPLHCQLAATGPQTIRATYDFSEPEQMGDWSSSSGTWGVAKGMLICKTEPYRTGQATAKLYFRGDRPLKIAFSGKAKHYLAVWLEVYDPLQRWIRHRYRFNFTDDYGLSVYTSTNRWQFERTRLQANKGYKFEIRLDGQGGYAWSINGTVVHEYKPDKARQLEGPLAATLRTESSDKMPTLFDNVIFEGEPFLPGLQPKPE